MKRYISVSESLPKHMRELVVKIVFPWGPDDEVIAVGGVCYDEKQECFVSLNMNGEYVPIKDAKVTKWAYYGC